MRDKLPQNSYTLRRKSNTVYFLMVLLCFGSVKVIRFIEHIVTVNIIDHFSDIKKNKKMLELHSQTTFSTLIIFGMLNLKAFGNSSSDANNQTLVMVYTLV